MPGLYLVFGDLNSRPHDYPPRWLSIIYPGPHFHLFCEIASLPLMLIFIWIIGLLICRFFFHKPYSFAEFLIHIMNYFLNIVELSAFTWISFGFITFTLKNSFSITCTSFFFFLWGLVFDSYYVQLSLNHFSCDFFGELTVSMYLVDQVLLPFYKWQS